MIEDGSGTAAGLTAAVAPAGDVLVKVCTLPSVFAAPIGTVTIDELVKSVVAIGGLFASLSRIEITN